MIQFRTIAAPISIQLEITPDCNNNCHHCYNYWRGDKKIDRMSTKNFLRTIDNLAKSGIFHITITGGEPLIERSLLIKIMERISYHNISFDINSNLTKLDNELILIMKRNNLLSILTSFHSYKKEDFDSVTCNLGSFEKTSLNIRRLIENEINVSVNMVVTKNNFENVYLTSKFISSLGVSHFNATRVQTPSREKDFTNMNLSKENIEYVLRQLLFAENDFNLVVGSVTPYPFCFLSENKEFLKFSRRTCNAGITFASVGCDGFTRACPNSSINYGNVLEDEFEKCWLAMKSWRDETYVPKECSDCYYLPICKGGCRSDGLISGNLGQRDLLMGEPIKSGLEDFLSQKTDTAFNEKSQFILYPNFRYRKENFGYALIGKRSGSAVFTSDIVLQTLLKLRSKKFSIKELLILWNTSLEEITDLLFILSKNGIIQRSEKGE